MSILSEYQDVLKRYADDATVMYAKQVLSGEVPAGETMKEACERQLSDLQIYTDISNDKYVYNKDLADRIIKFATLLRDVTTGEPFKPSPYQKFLLAMLVGWRVNDEDNGARFKTVFISMARTNGKTQLLATYALYLFLFGNPKVNRQIAIASIDIQHTQNLYKYMTYNWDILSEGVFKKLKRELEIEYNRNEMRIIKTKTTMKRLSAQGSPADSDHYTVGVIDEYHLLGYSQKEFINSMTSGMINNEQAQMVYISTAGVNPTGSPMYEDYRRYRDALLEKKLSDRVLFLVWEQDKVSEMNEPETWIKANPLMELPNMHKTLMQGMLAERDEKLASGNQSEFIVKNMNMWQNAKENRYLNLEYIQDAISEKPPINIFGRDVYIGYDYSQVSDDTALAFVFPYKDINGEERFYIYQHSFVPTARVDNIEAKEKQDNIPYRKAEEQGFASIAKNRFGQIDGDVVLEWLINFIDDNNLNVKAVLYDSWRTDEFTVQLDNIKNNLMIIKVRQGTQSLDAPTKFLQKKFVRRQIDMVNDPVLKTGLTNAVIVSDNNGIKVDKNKATEKIDAVDALIDAFYEAEYYFTDYSNAPEDKSVFGNMTQDEINDFYINHFSL